MPEPPAFLTADPRRRQAFDFAAAAYDGKLLRHHQDFQHPLRAAELLDAAGADEDVVIAGVLHDVLEDTDTPERAVRERFGDRVADLVSAVSEDADIDDYHERKAALRRKIADAGSDAATIALADKVATIEQLRSSGEPLSPEREHHYRESLRVLEERCGELPFAAQLRDGLDALTRR
jgi:(p)ppGpp synthase/HD superfamily hydrolase